MERHPFDVLSLIFGLVFTVIAALSLAGALPLENLDLRLIAPALLVLFGLVLVVGAGVPRRRGETEAHPTVDVDAEPVGDAPSTAAFEGAETARIDTDRS
jgi:hypothetical protein